MVVVILLLFLTLALAKENFRVSPNTASAAEICYNAGLCDAVNGCCSGHGYCDSTTIPNPTCVCDVPTGCHSSFTTPYSGTHCETGIIGDPLGSPDGCCISDTYVVKREINGACNPRSGNDPNAGLKGNLLRRSTNQSFSDPYGGTTVEDIADYLTHEDRDNLTETTTFNMLGLALLQAGQLDIVRYALSDTEFHNISGELIPKLKYQERTGEAWGTSTSVKKEFENRATGQIDLDFLYEYAVRIPEATFATTGPFINYTSVISHFSKLVSQELLVLIQFFGYNHNFLVRTLETSTWNKTSWDAVFDHTTDCLTQTSLCSTYTTNQQIYDKLFEWARSANIRLLQVALGNAALSLLAPHDQPAFEYYFHAPERSWSCELRWNEFRSGDVANTGVDLSGGSIFTEQITRNKPFTHYAASGIHYLYSMASPVTYTSITPDPTCNVPISALAQDVFSLAATPTKKFGSRVDPSFYDGLTLQLLRERELEVESYNSWLAQTGDFVARVDTVLSLGLHKDVDPLDGEFNALRLFQGTGVPRVLLALYTPINDALMIDEFGVWTQRSNGIPSEYMTELTTEQAFDYNNCYYGGDFCISETQMTAWSLLVGWRSWDPVIQEEIFRLRSVMQTSVCTYPGLSGAITVAANVHHGIIAPLIVNFDDGWSTPSYHTYNQPSIDFGYPWGLYKTGHNSLNACIPWRTTQTSEIDSKCCSVSVSVGECGCDVNAVTVFDPCTYESHCPYYDEWYPSQTWWVYDHFINNRFDPVQPDGLS